MSGVEGKPRLLQGYADAKARGAESALQEKLRDLESQLAEARAGAHQRGTTMPTPSSVPSVARGALARNMQAVRTRIYEILLDKLLCWRHIPLKALGVFWCECGGMRRCVSEC